MSSTYISSVVVTSSITALPNTNYICDSTSLITITLPLVCPTGAIIKVSGLGTGGWTIAPNTGQTILTTDVSFISNQFYAVCTLQCVSANSLFRVIFYQGSISGHSDRGLSCAGQEINVINYFTISSASNAADFGDMALARYYCAAVSSSTRGVIGGGISSSSYTASIEYSTITTKSNSSSFGSLTIARSLGSCSNSYRGVFGGGSTGSATNILDYITISTTSVSADFGDTTQARFGLAGCASSTRGVFSGGYTVSTQDYVTLATLGNAVSFGNIIAATYYLGSCANAIRGITEGGSTGSATNTINYFTIATTASTQDFGDLSAANTDTCATSSGVKGIIVGGQGFLTSTVQITFATTGNSTSFGTLPNNTWASSSLSNCHGGLL